MNRELSDRTTILYTGIIYYALLTAYIVCSFFPEYRLWGFNWLAYHPLWLKATLFGIGVAAFPAALLLTRRDPELNNNKPNTRCYVWTAIVISLLLTACFVLFRTKTHFLGDGYTLLASLSENLAVFIKARNYGESIVHVWLYDLMSGTGKDHALLTYQIIAITAGSIFVTITAVFSFLSFKTFSKRILLFLGLISSGYMLLFFGYVENYSLFVTSVLTYCLCGLLIFRNRAGISKWLILFPQALMIFFHIFGLLFFPATIVLLLTGTRMSKQLSRLSAKTKLLITMGVTISAFVALQILAGSNLTLKLALVPLFDTAFTVEGYTLFSLPHLLDFVNLLLLLLPALPILLFLLYSCRTDLLPNRVGTVWMVASTLIPLAAIFLLDPKLGMPRDWDLFAFTGIPLTIFLYYALLSLERSARAIRVGLILSVVLASTMLAARVAALNSEKISVSHFKNYLHLDKIKNRNAWVMLNNYYMDKGDSASVIANVKIRNSLFPEEAILKEATVLYGVGNLRGASEMTRLAIRLNPLHSEAYALLGTLFSSNRQFDSSLHYYEIAHTMNPHRAMFLNGLGMAHLWLNHLEQSESLYLRARELDPNDFNAPYGLHRTYRLMSRLAESEQFLIEAGHKRGAPLYMQKELFHQYLNSSKPEKALRYMAWTRELAKDTSLIRLLMERVPGFGIDSSRIK